MMLEVDVCQKLGDFELNATFASGGRLIALFGASGSGKTSLVNLISGLARPDQGRIVAAGQILVDIEAGIFVPAHKRRIGYVFQDARLFPHMSVRQNLRYGRFFIPASERYADMNGIVDLLGIDHLLDRKPALLSGGEKQRVAIGRALISSPRLVLMDEPLASLDDARKVEIIPYIERLRDEMKIPIIYVSHSVSEVARLATDIVVLSGGTVTISGLTPLVIQRLDILPDEERGEGGSVLEMIVSALDENFGMTVFSSGAGDIRAPVTGLEIGRRIRVRLRARDVMIAVEKPHGFSALNILSGSVKRVKEADGAFADVWIDCHGQTILSRITRLSAVELGLTVGRPVFAVIKSVTFDRGNIAA